MKKCYLDKLLTKETKLEDFGKVIAEFFFTEDYNVIEPFHWEYKSNEKSGLGHWEISSDKYFWVGLKNNPEIDIHFTLKLTPIPGNLGYCFCHDEAYWVVLTPKIKVPVKRDGDTEYVEIKNNPYSCCATFHKGLFCEVKVEIINRESVSYEDEKIKS